jgi:hypothetical protein
MDQSLIQEVLPNIWEAVSIFLVYATVFIERLISVTYGMVNQTVRI